MSQMTELQSWSANNLTLPAPIRSVVMHAWLTHIHPYIDGNGRTSRAVGNLELIRAGYPPIIIKKKERDRYIGALAESDERGDIRSFMELVFDRIEGGLIGLENSAKMRQGYNPVVAKIRVMQEKQLKIWDTSVKLLASIIEHRITNLLEPVGGSCTVKLFDDLLDLNDYVELCLGNNVPRSWAFTIRLDVPGIHRLEKLAYIGHRSARMYQNLSQKGGPSLFWSQNNDGGFPKWISSGSNSPYAVEITSMAGDGDDWIVRLNNDSIEHIRTTVLANNIANALVSEIKV